MLLEARNYADDRCLQFAFPNGNDLPSEAFEFSLLLFIASDVLLEFRLPKLGVVLRQSIGTFWTMMPEAAVDKDRYFF